jgi:hypothetical protein
MYAFQFATTEEQDDALIAKMNSGANHSRYSLVFWNCADFSSAILNFYFPRTFRRSPFPDAGITTPMQVTYELVRYARQHPETQLSVLAIPQVPGLPWPQQTEQEHRPIAHRPRLSHSPCGRLSSLRRWRARRLARVGPLSSSISSIHRL